MSTRLNRSSIPPTPRLAQAEHFKHLGDFRAVVDGKADKDASTDGFTCHRNKVVVSAVLHLADLGASTKSWPLCEKWAHRVMNEFFAQGDAESALGLPLGPLNDRDGTFIPKSQCGFLDFICMPLWETWEDFVGGDTVQYKVGGPVGLHQEWGGAACALCLATHASRRRHLSPRVRAVDSPACQRALPLPVRRPRSPQPPVSRLTKSSVRPPSSPSSLLPPSLPPSPSPAARMRTPRTCATTGTDGTSSSRPTMP